MSGTAPTIEARYSAARLWCLAAVFDISAAGAWFLGFGPYVHWMRNPPLLLLGTGVAFCGAFAILFIYMAIVKSGKVAFTVGPDGILDTRISKDVIPWSSIEAISTWRNPQLPKNMQGGERVVLLQLKPGQEARLPIAQFARTARTADRSITGSDGFQIRTGGTDIGYKRLLEVSQSYLASAKS